MRILYYYAFQQFDTGSPKALAGMIEGLDRSRFTPLFLAAAEGPLVTELERLGVEIIRSPAGSISWRRPFTAFRRLRAMAALLRRHRIDLVHVNEFGWNLDVALSARLLGIPVVLHVHNALEVTWQNLDRVAASRVIFVSAAHRDTTVHLERLHGKAVVLHNPVDVARFESGRNIRAQLGLAPSAIVVTAVCQLNPDKGLDDLFEAAGALIPRWPDLHFLVVGRASGGQEAYAESLRARAAAEPWVGRIHFLGSRQDVPDILASSDIFFLPTRGETFGIVVAEAMAASLPVVSSRVGGVPEIVRDEEEGLLTAPRDVAGYTAALEALIADPARRAAIGRRARAGLAGRLDADSFRRSLAAIYDSLA